MRSVEERARQLEERLASLQRRIGRIEDELVSHDSKDWEEMAIEREQDEVLEGMGIAGQQEIAQIRAALARIDAGEYGQCVTCGADIAEPRLDLLPQTPFCAACAR